MDKVEIHSSYQLDLGSLTGEEHEIFHSLPTDYQSFLRKTNGGMISTPYQWFSAPITRTMNGQTYRQTWNAVEQFWAFISYINPMPNEDGVNSILHEHIDQHIDEKFLPKGIYGIAHCLQNSLLCLLTNQADLGAIYYWEWYWQYPWYKPFFDERIKRVFEQMVNAQEILDNPAHPEYEVSYNALNYMNRKISGSRIDIDIVIQ